MTWQQMWQSFLGIKDLRMAHWDWDYLNNLMRVLSVRLVTVVTEYIIRCNFYLLNIYVYTIFKYVYTYIILELLFNMYQTCVYIYTGYVMGLKRVYQVYVDCSQVKVWIVGRPRRRWLRVPRTWHCQGYVPAWTSPSLAICSRELFGDGRALSASNCFWSYIHLTRLATIVH